MILAILIRSVSTLVTVFSLLIIARALISWIHPSGYSKLYHDIEGTLDLLTDPLVAPIRRVMPTLGPFDLSPIVALILLQIVGSLVVQLLAGIR